MKKKILLISAAVVSALLIIFLGLVVSAPSRVEGTWRHDFGYSETHNCNAVSIWTFNSDKTYTRILINADTEEVLNSSSGTWSMSLFEVKAREPAQNGYTPFTFNPITNILNNGGGLIIADRDVVYRKLL